MRHYLLDVQIVATGPTPNQLAAALGPEIPTVNSQPITVEPGPTDPDISWATTTSPGIYRIGIMQDTGIDANQDIDTFSAFDKVTNTVLPHLKTRLPNLHIEELTAVLMTDH